MKSQLLVKKDLIAIGAIALSIIGLVCDLILKRPVADTLSIGFLCSFTGFLLSLASVKDSGGKFLAMAAFWIGFICMWVTLGICLF